eukprot:COSAG02_NODE_3249_length_7096_cov_5.491496_7_plen_63_part_00
MKNSNAILNGIVRACARWSALRALAANAGKPTCWFGEGLSGGALTTRAKTLYELPQNAEKAT